MSNSPAAPGIPAFAVVCTAPIYCPDTDAIMGAGSFVYERFLTRSAALLASERLNRESGGDEHFQVKMLPYKENEGTFPMPKYSALELYYDARAEDCPEWAR